jgi:hypothetical protein
MIIAALAQYIEKQDTPLPGINRIFNGSQWWGERCLFYEEIKGLEARRLIGHLTLLWFVEFRLRMRR